MTEQLALTCYSEVSLVFFLEHVQLDYYTSSGSVHPHNLLTKTLLTASTDAVGKGTKASLCELSGVLCQSIAKHLHFSYHLSVHVVSG